MEKSMTLGTENDFGEAQDPSEKEDEFFTLSEASKAPMERDEAVIAESLSSASDSAFLDLRALKGILEALLFVSADPMPVTRFVALLGAVTRQQIEQALACLRHDYEQEGRGVQLAEVAGGYQIMTKAEFAPWLKRLEKVKAPSKLSRSALESLAIIAYKQPIVRAEVEQIRGVETSGVIRTLLERKLVRIVGRKEEPGRPIMYGTTKTFLEHFGLRDLSQLPPLRDFRELGESEQAVLPIDEGVAVGDDASRLSPESSHMMGEGLPEEVQFNSVNGAAYEMNGSRAVDDRIDEPESGLVAADDLHES
jgi:segregation and condensation protein B